MYYCRKRKRKKQKKIPDFVQKKPKKCFSVLFLYMEKMLKKKKKV